MARTAKTNLLIENAQNSCPTTIRLRTPSAACQSVSPSAYWITITIARREAGFRRLSSLGKQVSEILVLIDCPSSIAHVHLHLAFGKKSMSDTSGFIGDWGNDL